MAGLKIKNSCSFPLAQPKSLYFLFFYFCTLFCIIILYLTLVGFPDENRREFQRGIDLEAGKLKRYEDRLTLRRQIREGYLNKRRRMSTKDTKQKGNMEMMNPHMSIGMNLTMHMHMKRCSSQKDKNDRSNMYHYTSTPAVVTVLGPAIPAWVCVENLERFAEQIKSSDLESIIQGVQAIRQLLSVEDKPPIEEIFDIGIVPYLLDILVKKFDIKDRSNKTVHEQKLCKLQFEASWKALINIASGDRNSTRKLVEMKCIEAFVQLLQNTEEPETIDQAIWGLGNITGDCPTLRDKVLK
ncbi:protein transporter, partial [Reticulomyxa filosa]